MEELLYGRRLLRQELPAEFVPPQQVEEMATMTIQDHDVRCLRCNTVTNKTEALLPRGQFFCPQCLTLGRVSTLASFYHLPEPNQFPSDRQPLTWEGTLSPLQEACAREVDQCLAHHQEHLLWAVTGAGKTEMLFRALAAAIRRGERLALASPRVDVCLELYPRLQRAFGHQQICLLHGRQTEPYTYRQLTICTTHQLLRFYHAFDNLIVDEVDAFPYASNPQLYFATQQAIKPDGGCLYLTATPGKALLQRVRRKQLTISYLPLRYHGHLLPEIKVRLVPKWRTKLGRQRLPQLLIGAMKKRLNSHQRFLLFVPHVADLAPIQTVLERQLGIPVTTVHAADDHRLAKVQAMRDEQIDFLVTTSILERGVTFPEIDVLVLGADDAVFSTAALVQIAGRAGRSVSRPTGDVLFWVGSAAKNVTGAQQQIKFVNRKGRRLQR